MFFGITLVVIIGLLRKTLANPFMKVSTAMEALNIL